MSRRLHVHAAKIAESSELSTFFFSLCLSPTVMQLCCEIMAISGITQWYFANCGDLTVLSNPSPLFADI